MIYSPSLACADQLYLGRDIKEIIEAGINMLHFDIMDGHYVPNICLSLDTASQIRQSFSEVLIDAHIMVTNPEDYIGRLCDAGVDRLAFHISSTNFAYRTIQDIKSAGMKAGIVLNPSEPISLIYPLLKYLDFVLIMSIEPGFAGQKFIDDAYDKVAELDDFRREKDLSYEISVDGGITSEIGKRLKTLGADILVLGYPAIFNQPEGIKDSFKKFKAMVEK